MAVVSLVPGAVVVTTGNDMDAIYNSNIMEIQTSKVIHTRGYGATGSWCSCRQD